MGERGKTVRDILTDMKDASEFALSLAYASLLYQDKDLAEEVMGLEAELDELRYELFKLVIMAGRSPKEAEGLAAIVDIGVAVDEITDSMADLAKLVLSGYPVHPALSWMLYHAEDVIGLIRVEKTSPLISMRGSDLEDPANLAGCEVLAIKKRGRWIFEITPDVEVEEGDLLLVEGTKEGLNALRELAGLEKRDLVEEMGFEIDDRSKRLAEMLRSIRSISELSIYLAYASVLYNNPSMASEVIRLEEEIDELEEKVYELVIRDVSAKPREAIPLIRMAASSERIGDAAMRMAQLVERGITAHPIFETVVEESEETIVRAVIREDSPAVGTRIWDLSLEEAAGTWIVAIKRGVMWIYAPKDDEILRAGDVVILIGPQEGIDDALKILGADPVE